MARTWPYSDSQGGRSEGECEQRSARRHAGRNGDLQFGHHRAFRRRAAFFADYNHVLADRLCITDRRLSTRGSVGCNGRNGVEKYSLWESLFLWFSELEPDHAGIDLREQTLGEADS